MATTTTRLVLRKPDPTPGTGDLVNASLDLNANWDKVDAAVGAVACTSGARPASPFNGQFARETDTGNLILWNGGLWVRVFFEGSARWPGGVEVQRTGAADPAFTARVVGSDTQSRVFIQADGEIWMGPGNATQDVRLYRSAANELKTDDRFICANFTIGTKAISGAYSTFTPTLLAAGGSPTVGNGTIFGRWKNITDKTVKLDILLNTGSTTNYGTGGMHFGNIPAGAAPRAVDGQAGSVTFYQNSTNQFSGACHFIGSSTIRPISWGGFTTATVPFALGSGQAIQLSILYEIA
jgi:hypothetical protein